MWAIKVNITLIPMVGAWANPANSADVAKLKLSKPYQICNIETASRVVAPQ